MHMPLDATIFKIEVSTVEVRDDRILLIRRDALA